MHIGFFDKIAASKPEIKIYSDMYIFSVSEKCSLTSGGGQICMIAKKINFSGRVQGVGFRYTAKKISASWDIYGYVKNLRDGTVELIAEGDQGEVANFLDQLQGAMGDNIEKMEVTDFKPTGYEGFEIQF